MTGGTGFFGRWMLESFLRANDELGLGAEAIVLTRDPRRFADAAPHVAGHVAIGAARWRRHGRSTTRPWTARTSSTWRPRRPSARPRRHRSRRPSRAPSGSLRFAARRGARKLLLTSSGAVYGTQPPDCERLSEEYIGAPRPEDASAGYAHGKRAAEFLARLLRRRPGCRPRSRAASRSSVRCCRWTPTSPSATSSATRSTRDRIEVAGDGTPRRSYLYAADLAIWLWTILFRGDSAGRTTSARRQT